MHDFFLSGEAWLALGCLLLVGEMVLGSGYVLLAFATGSLVNGLLLYSGFAPAFVQTTLLHNMVFVAAISFALLYVIRKFLQRPDTEDINKY